MGNEANLGRLLQTTHNNYKDILPISLKSLCVTQQASCPKEKKDEAGCKSCMEVVAGPGHPVVAVIDVGIRVVPRPPQQFDSHDVIWYVNKYNAQANCKGPPKTSAWYFTKEITLSMEDASLDLRQ